MTRKTPKPRSAARKAKAQSKTCLPPKKPMKRTLPKLPSKSRKPVTAKKLAELFDVTPKSATAEVTKKMANWLNTPEPQQKHTGASALAEKLRSATFPLLPPKKKNVPTAEQQAIIEAAREVLHTGGVLMIEAGAGTGKTSTLRMLADTLPGVGQYTAFNSSLVAESKAKFQGTRVACNTTHSLAFRAEGKRFSHRLNGQRVRADQLARMLDLPELSLTVGEKQKRLAPGWLVTQVTGAIRRFCQSADSEVAESHFKYVDGIDVPSSDGQRSYDNNTKLREFLLPFAQKAWRDASNPDGQLPFTHGNYVKLWQLSSPIISGDYILLDEAQDTAPVMLDILQQQKAVVILVGDSAQQIYEWRGAINALTSFPGAPRKLLSQSFRFGEAIAAVANKVLGTLEEPSPLHLKGLPSIPSRIIPVAEPRAILCRTNAVAVSNLLNAISAGKKPFLVGGGADVIAFVQGAQCLQQRTSTSYPELACFDSWTEVQEYSKEEEGEDLRLMVKLIDSFGASTILEALRSMPLEKDADLVISTAHKSKGREWDTVRLASDFPTASKCSDSDRKLLYVAVTRAKLDLDVSECPFFTGKDSIDISCAQKPVDSVLPPAPSVAPAPTEFTWCKKPNEDAWLVRGPKGFSGKTVEVTRKDGSKAKKTLGAPVFENDIISTYRVQ